MSCADPEGAMRVAHRSRMEVDSTDTLEETQAAIDALQGTSVGASGVHALGL